MKLSVLVAALLALALTACGEKAAEAPAVEAPAAPAAVVEAPAAAAPAPAAEAASAVEAARCCCSSCKISNTLIGTKKPTKVGFFSLKTKLRSILPPNSSRDNLGQSPFIQEQEIYLRSEGSPFAQQTTTS